MSLHVHCTAFYSPATEALININRDRIAVRADIWGEITVSIVPSQPYYAVSGHFLFRMHPYKRKNKSLKHTHQAYYIYWTWQKALKAVE